MQDDRALIVDGSSNTCMHGGGRHVADAGVEVLVVVPGEERLAERARLFIRLNTPEQGHPADRFDFLPGGGSVIDGAKLVAAAAPHQGDPWNLMETGGASVTSTLPFGTVLTLPATGSEMNNGSVVTLKATQTKLPFRSIYVFPQLTALYDIDHARTLAIVLPALLDVQRDKKRAKLLQYGERVWKITTGSEEQRIDAAIKATRSFFESLGIPTRLSAFPPMAWAWRRSTTSSASSARTA